MSHFNYTSTQCICIQFIREHGGWNDWTYGKLETATLTTMEQRKLKRHYIETLKATLNTYLHTRTDKERATRDATLATPSNNKANKRKSKPCNFCLASMYLMNQFSYIKLRFKGESLLLKVQRISEDTVIGRVANHPANPRLLLTS